MDKANQTKKVIGSGGICRHLNGHPEGGHGGILGGDSGLQPEKPGAGLNDAIVCSIGIRRLVEAL